MTSGGKLVFHVFAALAEFKRDLDRPAPLDLRPHLALCRVRGSGQFRKPSRDFKKE